MEFEAGGQDKGTSPELKSLWRNPMNRFWQHTINNAACGFSNLSIDLLIKDRRSMEEKAVCLIR
jgi:hypothetical protein